MAYGLERLDNKVRSAEQVEQITGLTVLGVIPIAKNVEEELADPGSALSRSPSVLVHGSAIHHGEWCSQDVDTDERRTRGGQVAHLIGYSETFRHHGSQGFVG